MVVEQNLASLRQARRRLDLFRNVGIDSRIVSVVVNRIEKRLFGKISLSDVAHALGHDVLLGLHVDAQSIGIAQDQGLLVSEVRPKSPYAADVAKLAGILGHRLRKGGQL
jgi:pilus assembly protein CpaE